MNAREFQHHQFVTDLISVSTAAMLLVSMLAVGAVSAGYVRLLHQLFSPILNLH